MDLSTETVIRQSRSKILLLIIGAVGFVAIGLWLLNLSNAEIVYVTPHRSPVYINGVGLVTAIFSGLCALLGIVKLLHRSGGLEFTEAGIIDGSSSAAVGFVPWTEIIGTKIYRVKRSRMLVVKLADPEKYIARGSAARRWLNRTNFKLCGSPIALSSSTLAIDFDELVSLFDTYLSRHRNDQAAG